MLATDGCYYPTAFRSVPFVGRCSADLLKTIFQNKPDIKAEQFHAIGFSLGAHVCAAIGVNLRPIVLPRITGKCSNLMIFRYDKELHYFTITILFQD